MLTIQDNVVSSLSEWLSLCFKTSIIFQNQMFQLLHLPLSQSSLMVWRSLECRLPRRGKPARCSDTPVAVWSTPKWLRWTTVAPLSGSVLTPPCRWKANCESGLGVALLWLYFISNTLLWPFSSFCSFVRLLSHPYFLVFAVAGTMERSAGQMQSLCSGCVKRPAIWWETARPARTTTPSPSSKESTLFS